MNVLDLFSGIGGFSVGLERAGMRTVAFCESDEFCRAVLRKHWPNVPCFDDVRTIDADRLGGLGRIDLVCGGFPCQPFSHAGKQRAQADHRHLWPAMREVIALARPAWVLGENVAGIIALALDDVLADLETIRYAARAFVIPAVAVDARHRRDRVWIIARDTHREGKPALSVNEEVEELRGPASDSAGMQRLAIVGDESYGDVSSYGASSNANGQGLPQRFGFAGMDCRQASRYSRENTALHRRWLPEPGVGRVADGVPNRVDRLRTLGNAVVPQVVEEIGRAIMRCAQ